MRGPQRGTKGSWVMLEVNKELIHTGMSKVGVQTSNRAAP